MLHSDNAASPAGLDFGEEEPFVTKLSDGVTTCVLWAQVLFVTMCMAYAETTDIFTLALCGLSVVSLAMFECHRLFHDVAGWWPSLAVACSAALLLIYVHVFLQNINQMERVAEKYAAVDCDLGLERLQQLESTEKEQGAGRASFQLRLGPLQVLVKDLRQSDSFVTLSSLLRKSAELGGQFETRVLLPLFQSLPSESTASSTAPTFNLKTAKRSREKTRLEYDEDFHHLKDTLRGSIICTDMTDVWIVWKALKQLEANGVLEVLQVKNRYRGPPMPGGYRDVNANVLFEGVICEVQIHTAGHYVLKKELHPSYKLCRSVGLVGDIEGIDSNGIIANTEPRQQNKPPHLVAAVQGLALFFVRIWFAGCCSVGAAVYSTMHALEYAEDEGEGWTQRWKAMSLAAPLYLIAINFLIDIWDAGRLGFAANLILIACMLYVWHFFLPAFFRLHAHIVAHGLFIFVPVAAVLLWRKKSRRSSAKTKLFPELRFCMHYTLE
jgi:hypothetical protein